MTPGDIPLFLTTLSSVKVTPMRVRAGTSGYSYKEWKGHFYPEDLQGSEMLGYYARQLDTVEINNTFYRMPSEKMLLGWNDQVPEGFSFVLKASRRITHQKRLKEVGDELSYLLQTASVLGRKLGPILFQLPPYFRKDAVRLQEFLALFPRRMRAAVEFRHASWFDDEVYEALRSRNVALVVADTGGGDDVEIVSTAGHGYLRLRREHYGTGELERWAERIASQPWDEAYVFFKHEDEGAGPRMATRFNELSAKRAP